MNVKQLYRHSIYASLLAGLAALVLYAFTAAPELPPGHDSAELIAAAASGGIAHPPGYPLYTMMGHTLVSISPWSPIYTMNLFSACCGALAVALLAGAFALFCESALAGGGAALIFAVSTTPWRLSVGAEVFALHLFFLAALLVLAAWWRMADKGRKHIVGLAAFVFGLACAHHQTIALLLIPLALFFWREHRREPERALGFTWWVLPLFALGLTPYLYLPWKAAQHPALNWGDPSSWQRFLWVVLRQGYGGTQLSTAAHANTAPLYHLFQWFISIAWWQFPLLAFILGIYGAVRAEEKQRPIVWLCGSLCLICGPIWSLIAAQPAGLGFVDMLERFYASSYIGFAGLVALGLAVCGRRTAPEGKPYLAIALALIAVALGGFLNWGRASARGIYVISDAYNAMVQDIPADALVVSCNDATSGALMYATAVEGRQFLSVPMGLAYSDWFRDQLQPEQKRAIVEGGLEGLMIYERGLGHTVLCEMPLPNMRGTMAPHGLLLEYFAPGEPLQAVEQYCIASLLMLEKYSRRDVGRDYSRQPFWAQFYAERWNHCYKVLVDALPVGSPMRQLAAERAGTADL